MVIDLVNIWVRSVRNNFLLRQTLILSGQYSEFTVPVKK